MPDGQRVGERDREVDGRERAEAAAERARDAQQVQRQLERLGRVLAVVRPQQHVEVDVAERRRDLVVDDPHHLLGRDPVGRQRGDQRAGARADVDVELVDALVDRQQVERAQRADLIDPAREAAAAEHERGARLARARGATAGASGALLELDDLAHPWASLFGGSAALGEVLLAGAHDHGLALDEVADLDAAALHGHERAVTAVLDAPARAADRRRGVAALGAERALAVAEQPPHALLGAAPLLARSRRWWCGRPSGTTSR